MSIDFEKAQQCLDFFESQQEHDIVQPISAEENQRHSGKDFRGIYQNPGDILTQLSRDIPLGYNGYGCPVTTPIGSHDTRLYRFLVSLPLAELMRGHIRIVGPSGAGKSEFLYKLVLHLTRNHDFSIIWFSTKWADDQQFFESLFADYTAISANDISLTRLTQGRFNPLSRIPITAGQVDPQDCRKMAEALIKCIPIQDISGETEKFYRDAVIRLAALIELLKYCYGDGATLEQIPTLWIVLAESDGGEHPIETLLQSSTIPLAVEQRIRKNLLPLLRRQSEGDAMIGPTAQQLLSQFESLASVTAADDISNFGDRLRHSPHGKVLIIDQSDGLNSSMSQALARLVFPQLYEELVAQCPANWQQQGLRPVLMVIDEMGSVFSGELSDFLEKARSKGVFVVFGQQSSAGNPDPRLNADMSNNTRLQVVFSGCDSTDPQVQELSAVAGQFRPPFEPHRSESGFGEQQRLPIDAITTLGPLASLVRIKSTTGREQILWMHQGNSLVPHRQQILALRHDLAVEIAQRAHQKEVMQLRSLLNLYTQAETLLLRSYGYWTAAELANAYQSLNLEAINLDYLDTMDALAKDSQTARENLALLESRPEFARNSLLNQAMTLVQWQHEQEYAKAQELEAWLFQRFERDILPELQKHLAWWSGDLIRKPKIEGFFGFYWGMGPAKVASHWQAILLKYKEYAEAWGRENPRAWTTIAPLVSLRIGQELLDIPPAPRKLEGLKRWLQGKKASSQPETLALPFKTKAKS